MREISMLLIWQHSESWNLKNANIAGRFHYDENGQNPAQLQRMSEIILLKLCDNSGKRKNWILCAKIVFRLSVCIFLIYNYTFIIILVCIFLVYNYTFLYFKIFFYIFKNVKKN